MKIKKNIILLSTLFISTVTIAEPTMPLSTMIKQVKRGVALVKNEFELCDSNPICDIDQRNRIISKNQKLICDLENNAKAIKQGKSSFEPCTEEEIEIYVPDYPFMEKIINEKYLRFWWL